MLTTWLLYQEVAGMVVEAQPAKPVTAVQDYVSTITSMKPMDIFQETLGSISSSAIGINKQVF